MTLFVAALWRTEFRAALGGSEETHQESATVFQAVIPSVWAKVTQWTWGEVTRIGIYMELPHLPPNHGS